MTLFRSLCFFVAGLLPTVAWGAEIEVVHLRYDPDFPEVISELSMTLSGEIEEGDAEKIRALNPGTSSLWADATGHAEITLDSQGGSFQEAIRLMDLFREAGISTRVTRDAECFSACAVAFMGGHHVNTGSVFWPNRIIEPGGRLGFHAPSLENVGDGMVPAEVLSVSYEIALEAIAAIIARKDGFQIADSLIETILGTPPSEMYIVKMIDDFKRWRIGINVAESPNWIPDQQEMAQLCRNVFLWQNGASAVTTEWEGSGPLPRELLYENRVAALSGRFISIPWSRSSDTFMAVQTLEYEWNEFCIIHNSQFRERNSISVYSTNSDPASFVDTLVNTNAPRTVVSSSDAHHPKTELATLRPGPPIFDFSAPQPSPSFTELDTIETPTLTEFRASGAANASTADQLTALRSTWGNPKNLGNGLVAATCPSWDANDRMFCVLIGCGQLRGSISVNVVSFDMSLPSFLSLSVIMENGYRIDFPLETVSGNPILHRAEPHSNTLAVLLRFLKKDQFVRLEYTTQAGPQSHVMTLSGSSRALSQIEQQCSM